MLNEVKPSSLLDGDDYASASDLIAQDDLPTATLQIARWHKNGKPLKIRVRGLSLLDQLDIDKIAGVGEKRDWPKWYVEILSSGIQVPTLDKEQARAMLRRNPAVIGELADFIWSLHLLNGKDIDDAVTALADIPDGSEASADSAA